MTRFLQIFGLLSVLFRGATLTFQSLTIGGIVFLLLVIPRDAASAESLMQVCLRWIRRSALALAVMQSAYVLANSSILMQSAQMTLPEVSGANFFIAAAMAVA